MRQMSLPQTEASRLPAADRGEIDLIALFREVGRRKWLVAAVAVGALVLSTVAVNIVKPRYTAETRVLLENRDTEYTRIGRDAGRGSDPLIDQDAVLSQVQLIQSRDIGRAMIRRFDLGQRPEFDDVLNGVDAVTKVGVMLGLFNNPAATSPEERVLEKYFDKLKAFAVAKSRVVAIEFQSRDPALAAQLSQAIAEEYIRQLEGAKKGSAKAAGSWLGRTIDTLRERVAAAEAKVEAYRTQNGLFLVGAGVDGGSITSQQLSELNTQLAAARSQQAELAAKARGIREAIRQGRIFEVSDIVNNDVVRRLIENRATLKALIAQEERTLLPQHPRVKELRAQLGGLEEQVRAAAERAARALENDSRAAGARLAASQGELDLQKRASGTANEQEVQLRALEREAKAEREQLETYLSRYRDAVARDADNAVTADARIVSNAIVPSNPSFPKRLPIIMVATLAGLCVSLFWILTRALLSDAVYVRRRDIADYPPMQPAWPVAAIQPYAVTLNARSIVAGAGARVAPREAPPQPSEPASPLRRSLDRVAEIMADARKASPDVAAADVGLRGALDADAPTLAPTAHEMAWPAPRSQPLVLASAAADDVVPDVDDPLIEVADEAEAALIRGRPVSILVLSIESERHAAPTAAALRRILDERGAAVAQMRERPSTASELSALVRGAAEPKDYVIANAGAVGPGAGAMSRAATLTVLVASDDLDDERTDEAARKLAGCDYFIVGARAAAEIAAG